MGLRIFSLFSRENNRLRRDIKWLLRKGCSRFSMLMSKLAIADIIFGCEIARKAISKNQFYFNVSLRVENVRHSILLSQ